MARQSTVNKKPLGPARQGGARPKEVQIMVPDELSLSPGQIDALFRVSLAALALFAAWGFVYLHRLERWAIDHEE